MVSSTLDRRDLPRRSTGSPPSRSLFRDPVIRLGVTGLPRAGKTVFITGLVANLLDRGRMPQLRAEAAGPDRGGLSATATRR